MTKTTINYLFPPDQIDNMPTWRYIALRPCGATFKDEEGDASMKLR